MSRRIDFIRDDIVRFPHCGRYLRGRYIGKHTKVRSEVAVAGGPSCLLNTAELQLVARPIPEGFQVYFKGAEIGVVRLKEEINPLRAKFRKGDS